MNGVDTAPAPGGPPRPAPRRRAPGRDRAAPAGDVGQASVELLGAVPAVLLVALVLFQVGAVGYASVLAGSAAEAGALAMAAGADPPAAARESLPGWSRARARVTARRGRVRVSLRPPSPIRAVSRALVVTGEAAVNAP